MGKIFKIYENKMERTWYDSSNVVYSECDDNEDAFKVLRVAFKDGRMYEYKDVNVNDYLLFRENLSQGKALNQFIKPKYEVSRLDDVNIDDLKHLMNEYQYGIATTNHTEEGEWVIYEGDSVLVKRDNEVITSIPTNQDLSVILGQLCSTLNLQFLNKTI